MMQQHSKPHDRTHSLLSNDDTYLLTKDLNSMEGGFPLISMSIPRDRQVDSMILKQHWMVGSWLQSSSNRWYDSSLLPTEPAEGDHTDEENEPRDPLPLLTSPRNAEDDAPLLPAALCMNRLMDNNKCWNSHTQTRTHTR